MSESKPNQEDDYQKSDALTEKLSGAFWYKGDGDWSKVREAGFESHEDGKAIVVKTKSIRYESVPHDLRQEAYDQYDGENQVIVGVDGVAATGVA